MNLIVSCSFIVFMLLVFFKNFTFSNNKSVCCPNHVFPQEIRQMSQKHDELE